MTRLFRFGVLVMLFVFVSWAAFQYNDPDPLLWIAVYGLAAVACLLFLLRRFPHRAALAYAALCLLGAAYLWTRVILAGEFFFDEQGREAMGLMVVSGVTYLLSRQSHLQTERVLPGR